MSELLRRTVPSMPLTACFLRKVTVTRDKQDGEDLHMPAQAHTALAVLAQVLFHVAQCIK